MNVLDLFKKAPNFFYYLDSDSESLDNLNLKLLSKDLDLEFVEMDFANESDNFEAFLHVFESLKLKSNHFVHLKNIGSLKPCDQRYIIDIHTSLKDSHLFVATQSNETAQKVFVDLQDFVANRMVMLNVKKGD